jgi:hypothetical protein
VPECQCHFDSSLISTRLSTLIISARQTIESSTRERLESSLNSTSLFDFSFILLICHHSTDHAILFRLFSFVPFSFDSLSKRTLKSNLLQLTQPSFSFTLLCPSRFPCIDERKQNKKQRQKKKKLKKQRQQLESLNLVLNCASLRLAYIYTTRQNRILLLHLFKLLFVFAS